MVALSGYNAAWQQYQDLQNSLSSAVDSQLAQQYSNILAQTFNARKKQALDAYHIFATATAPPLPAGITFPGTYVGERLAMIARSTVTAGVSSSVIAISVPGVWEGRARSRAQGRTG